MFQGYGDLLQDLSEVSSAAISRYPPNATPSKVKAAQKTASNVSIGGTPVIKTLQSTPSIQHIPIPDQTSLLSCVQVQAGLFETEKSSIIPVNTQMSSHILQPTTSTYRLQHTPVLSGSQDFQLYGGGSCSKRSTPPTISNQHSTGINPMGWPSSIDDHDYMSSPIDNRNSMSSHIVNTGWSTSVAPGAKLEYVGSEQLQGGQLTRTGGAPNIITGHCNVKADSGIGQKGVVFHFGSQSQSKKPNPFADLSFLD